LRIRSIVSWLLSLALVGAGVALIAFFFLNQGSESTATNEADPEGFNVPELVPSRENNKEVSAEAPEDKTLTVTAPKMSRFQNDTVPDAEGDDEEALKNYAAIHLKGTGFPWEEEANVYLAGHRLGYPGTESFLAFYDQDKLEVGDEIYVEDSEGRKYTYRVFKSLVVDPTDLWVTEPIEGKNILTLQTCTLPDYTRRIITQAELVEVA
jgi:sortase A